MQISFRTLIIIVAALVLLLAWFLLRSEPAFDLDRFDENVSRLQRGFAVARKAADIDSIPDWVRAEAEHLKLVGETLAAGQEDCAETAEALARMQKDFLKRQAAMDGYLSAEEIANQPQRESMQMAQKIIFALAPAYAELQPRVHDWAEACPEESKVLFEILGVKEEKAAD